MANRHLPMKGTREPDFCRVLLIVSTQASQSRNAEVSRGSPMGCLGRAEEGTLNIELLDSRMSFTEEGTPSVELF